MRRNKMPTSSKIKPLDKDDRGNPVNYSIGRIGSDNKKFLRGEIVAQVGDLRWQGII